MSRWTAPTDLPRLICIEGDCWMWQSYVSRLGYGYLGRRLAHRVIFEMLVGPIAAGMHLDHICRRRACVNPDHLEPVTRLENNRRSNPMRRRFYCKRGHPLLGSNLYVSPSGVRGCRYCRTECSAAWKRAGSTAVAS